MPLSTMFQLNIVHIIEQKNTTTCLLLKLILYWMIFMVNPSKSYFAQNNIVKDRPVFILEYGIDKICIQI
jgi:hypothetical protein